MISPLMQRVLNPGALFIIGLAFVLYAIRLASPSDLLDFAQDDTVAYVLDLTQNHHWACQLDETGDVMSKPPGYNWLAGLTSIAVGSVNRFSVTFPAFLATAATALLILHYASRYWNQRTGFAAALAYLLSPFAIKQVALARTDGLFALWIFAAAFAG